MVYQFVEAFLLIGVAIVQVKYLTELLKGGSIV